MRPLNRFEKVILMDFKNPPKIIGADYERIDPRATLCHIYIENKFWFIPLNPIVIHGVTVRNENDVEDPKIGEEWSFKRAVKLYIKKQKACNNLKN